MTYQSRTAVVQQCLVIGQCLTLLASHSRIDVARGETDSSHSGNEGNGQEVAALALEHEQEWKRVFQAELNRPVIEKAPFLIMPLPEVVDNVVIGMEESELREVRPAVSDEESLLPGSIREMFPFVPGLVGEQLQSTEWEHALYHIRHRRVVGVTLRSRPIVERGEANEFADGLVRDLAASVRLSGQVFVKQNMSPANPGVGAVMWTNNQQFVSMIRLYKDSNKPETIRLVVGSTAYWPDILSAFRLTNAPHAEAQEVLRGIVPCSGDEGK